MAPLQAQPGHCHRRGSQVKKKVSTKGPKTLDAALLSMSWDRESGLAVRGAGLNVQGARVLLCLPLTKPGQLAMLETKDGKELALLTNMDGLNEASKAAFEASLRRRVLTARILKVHSLAHQFGAIYWSVDTDRGPREFVLKGVTEHVRWLSDSRLLITDVDGNRFEITDLGKLDSASQEHVDLVL